MLSKFPSNSMGQKGFRIRRIDPLTIHSSTNHAPEFTAQVGPNQGIPKESSIYRQGRFLGWLVSVRTGGGEEQFNFTLCHPQEESTDPEGALAGCYWWPKRGNQQ